MAKRNNYEEIEAKIIVYLKTKPWAATWVIANTIGMRGKTSRVLKVLKRMSRENIVKTVRAESSINNYVWRLL